MLSYGGTNQTQKRQRQRQALSSKAAILFTLFLLHNIDTGVIVEFVGSTKDKGDGDFIHPTGCHGFVSGHTFPCPCSTGMIHVNTEETKSRTFVFNQCPLGIKNGAFHGTDSVKIESKGIGEMGMAVYSVNLSICGGDRRECYCTCFDKDAVDGAVGFQTSISMEDMNNDKDEAPGGFVTDCLGLCGPNCEQGLGFGKRYASILIHDVCQSFIRSNQPMPNTNVCSDEGWRALPAAFLSLFTNGFCPSSSRHHSN